MNALALQTRPKLLTAVIAGTVRQYENWLRARHLTWRDAFFVTCADDLREVVIARFVLVGTWQHRRDAEALCRLAEQRMVRE